MNPVIQWLIWLGLALIGSYGVYLLDTKILNPQRYNQVVEQDKVAEKPMSYEQAEALYG